MNPEIFGYVASGLVLATFTMRTMIPLRILGIASNVAFILYGYLDGLIPVIALHAILLPLNVYRLAEMQRLVREIKEAGSAKASDLHWLLPFMHPVSRDPGATLFRKGDNADAMYLLTDGRIRLSEFDVEVQPGEVVGEIGLFSPQGTRTATALCVEGCRLQCITRERVRELALQNPRFGFYLLGIVASRLIEDLRIIERRVSARGETGMSQA
jgi:CRP/FNR family cyclic AMP-dependent transcriptional regulator